MFVKQRNKSLWGGYSKKGLLLRNMVGSKGNKSGRPHKRYQPPPVKEPNIHHRRKEPRLKDKGVTFDLRQQKDRPNLNRMMKPTLKKAKQGSLSKNVRKFRKSIPIEHEMKMVRKSQKPGLGKIRKHVYELEEMEVDRKQKHDRYRVAKNMLRERENKEEGHNQVVFDKRMPYEKQF